ncbi:MAG: PEP-CTERM sorting domain-containing protein [Oscillatoriales cyanobacterium RU_3_3]|nr:PEP-CTERM sorting domain-containing protein [Microcoleus sp. SM1_3_4]NJM59692.1 PEP-CTERM sorting domain-containing protein [Oscillatoriales cyanobacterium RU_3_3]NJR22388.1 PEP-CTERM sorting domain-containing protein [Richelia sp. CSU_2_1]
MNLKQKQRVGSAIASTILSCAALSLAVVDKAQAAVLTYNFQVGDGGGNGFFKLNNSSLTGIGDEEVAVSEGKFNTILTVSSGKNNYDLVGAIALFYQGKFRGLQASGSDSQITEIDIPPEVEGGPYYIKYDGRAFWSMATNGRSSPDIWKSYLSGYREVLISDRNRVLAIDGRRIFNDSEIAYTLVDTAAEPVPEPITFAGTALALGGLSWLKYKKKTAV